MANHVTGTSAPLSVLPTSLGELRQHVPISSLGNPLYSEAKRLLAKSFLHECEDRALLTRWRANGLTEITRRATVADRQRRHADASAIRRRLPLTAFQRYRLRLPDPAAAWLSDTTFSQQSDRLTYASDRAASAHLQLTDALTFAHQALSCSQS